MKRYGQKDVAGAYATDDEGVQAQDVSLVEDGVLKNLLMSRAPVKGMDASNGHGRGGSVLPSVIHVISTNKKPYDQLKQNLINAAKEEGRAYGYIIRGLASSVEAVGNEADTLQILLGQSQPEPNQFRLTKPYSVFRLYTDGREERIRGVEIGLLNVNVLRDVLSVSEDEIVYDFPASAINLMSGLNSILLPLLTGGILDQGRTIPATIITPSLLINGIDLRKSSAKYSKPPVVAYPTF